MSGPLLDVTGLTITYSGSAVVKGFDMAIEPGTRCGLVGESGSGKSSIVKAVLGLIRPPGEAVAERIALDGVGDVSKMSASELRNVRGRAIGYIGQNPFGVLHPVISIAKQFEGFLKDHDSWQGGESIRRVSELLAGLGIADPDRVLRGHAGALSGGMAQRVAIALASLLHPYLLIADEPTTALDVTVQRQVLDLIAQPRVDSAQALLLVTHDLAVVAQYCDEVVVLRNGEVMERGPVASVFTSPQHHYTESLLDSVPGTTRRSSISQVTHEPARLHVVAAAPQSPAPAPASPAAEIVLTDDNSAIVLDGLEKTYSRAGVSVQAVRGVSLRIERGETLALVGESGSGKSTLGRLATLLERPDNGQVVLEGTAVSGLTQRRLRRLRPRMQIVFQEPYQSLNPQLRVSVSVAEPLQNLRPKLSKAEIADRVNSSFELAGLHPRKGDRYPHQLSGGEQQRVGIARAVATRPAFIVLDEPTSSLDLTVRAAIVAQLQLLQRELGVAYLFISHDLATARQIANRVAVMYQGKIVESGPAKKVLSDPKHPYTQVLSEACLDPDPRVPPQPVRRRGSAVALAGTGCPFLPRCERATDECRVDPPLVPVGDDRLVACLHPVGAGVAQERTVERTS